MSLESSLYIADNSHLSKEYLAKILKHFLPVFSLSFHLFTEQKFLILKTTLTVSPFKNSAFDVKYKNSLPRFRALQFSFFKKFYSFVFYTEAHDPFLSLFLYKVQD